MDEGTNVKDILKNSVIPLKLGYVPVVNRSQRDIETNQPIREALRLEREFFESHPAYSDKAQFCGTPYLAQKLSKVYPSKFKNQQSKFQKFNNQFDLLCL